MRLGSKTFPNRYKVTYLKTTYLVQWNSVGEVRGGFLELIVELCSEGFILYVNSLYRNIGREMSIGKRGQGIPEHGVGKGPQ